MPKGVAFLDRYERISLAANKRYLDGLVGVQDPGEARRALTRLAAPKRKASRRARGFNPANPDDAKLLAAVLSGEHVIAGFRNRDIRHALLGSDPDDRSEAKRRSARVTRLLNRLHVHGYVAKVPRTRRWHVTDRGRTVMSAVIDIRENAFPAAFAKMAA